MFADMAVMVQKISALTASGDKHADLRAILQRCFGHGAELRRGRRLFFFARCQGREYPILNLEQGSPVTRWGRMIFHVADVDAFWAYLREKGFHPESPQDASWDERYFHMSDPDGHELSFARPI
jgi:hypothetical protein